MFTRWLRALLFLVVVAVPAGLIVHCIATWGVDVPFWDDWENAQFFTVSRYGHESLAELCRLQNECRLLFPNLIFLLLSLPGDWSVVREMYFEVAIVAGICASLFQLLRRTGFSLLIQGTLLLPIAWLLFSPTQHENWLFGIQICYYLVPASLCFALVVNVSAASLGWKTAASLALAFVATYSCAGGVLICPLAFPGLLPANWSAAGGWKPTRRELVWHAVYLIGTAATLIAYFWDYTQPGGQGSLLYLFIHLGAPLNYLFAWLGSPIFPFEPVSQAIHGGMVILGLLLVLLAAACWRGLASRAEQPRLYPWVILAAYTLGTGAITVIGRSVYGVHQALSSRYISFSSYACVVILVLATYLWSFHRQRVPTALRYFLGLAGLGTLAAAGWFFTDAQIESIPSMEDSNHRRNFAKQGISFLPLMPVSQNLDALCGVSEYVQLRAYDLLRRHMLEIPVASAALLNDLQQVTDTGDMAFGVLDEPDMDANSRVSVRGWAVDPASKRPAGRVLVTVTAKDGVTHPLVVLCTDIYRPEEAPAAGEYQKMPCAFMGLASFDRLPPGDYLVAAWEVFPNLDVVRQIGATWPFHWTRPGAVTRPLDSFVFPPLDPRQSDINGSLESASLRPDNLLEVHGWGVNVTFSTPPKAVLITCTDSAGATRVIGRVGPNERRKDVADIYRNDRLTYSGFQARIDVSKLAPGSYQVAAWDVGDVSDNVEETVAQLSEIIPLRVPPR